MFIGHFGVGFGLKEAAPKVSLGTLFLAAQFIDLLWPTLLLLGIERVEIAPLLLVERMRSDPLLAGDATDGTAHFFQHRLNGAKLLDILFHLGQGLVSQLG